MISVAIRPWHGILNMCDALLRCEQLEWKETSSVFLMLGQDGRRRLVGS